MPNYQIYITSYGDTFDILAFVFYDDPLLASVIIDANPNYAGTLIFEDNVELRIPEINTVEISSTLPPWRQ
mgnify:CR=1 FL=1